MGGDPMTTRRWRRAYRARDGARPAHALIWGNIFRKTRWAIGAGGAARQPNRLTGESFALLGTGNDMDGARRIVGSVALSASRGDPDAPERDTACGEPRRVDPQRRSQRGGCGDFSLRCTDGDRVRRDRGDTGFHSPAADGRRRTGGLMFIQATLSPGKGGKAAARRC